ncbi:unnamed protein product, partial [Mesorhabditis spiculigera]
MDFLESLKNEMAKKRKAVEDIQIQDGSTKYIRRGDLVAKQQQEYEEHQKKKYGEQKPETSHTSPVKKAGKEKAHVEPLTDKRAITEIFSRLRQRNQPIRLFGEEEAAIRARLFQLELEQPELGEGRLNDLEAARRAVDNDLVKEVIEGAGREKKKNDVLLPDYLDKWPKIMEGAEMLGKDDDMARDCRVISMFFKYILSHWGTMLNNRPDDVKKSNAGKHDAAYHMQTVEYMRPLIRLLDKEQANHDIRHHLAHICRLMIIDRNYIQASNAYMEMAIGNAPWPVGVTRSGIHQRPGSAKAYVSNVAHVLNDETQRKYIQSVKRIITRAQEYFPTDPSKCVEYVRPQQ